MGCRSNKFCNSVGERGMRVDMEDRIRVLAVIHAASGKNDGDEVYACILEEWCRT